MRPQRCALLQGEHEEAIASSGLAIKARPDSVDAIYFRGQIYYSLGEYEYANNHMTSCLKQDPEHKKCKDMFRLLKKISNLRKAADSATSAVTIRVGKDDALKVGHACVTCVTCEAQGGRGMRCVWL